MENTVQGSEIDLHAAQNAEGFAFRLRKALELIGINRTEFARKLEVPGPNVSQWLSGVTMWNAMMLCKAQYLFPSVNFFYVTGGASFGTLEDSLLMREAKIVNTEKLRDEKANELDMVKQQLLSLEGERVQHELRVKDLEKMAKLYELLLKTNGIELP